MYARLLTGIRYYTLVCIASSLKPFIHSVFQMKNTCSFNTYLHLIVIVTIVIVIVIAVIFIMIILIVVIIVAIGVVIVTDVCGAIE